MRMGRLPEKPWTVDAVFRLVVAIFICVLMGAVVAAVIGYFGVAPHKSPALFVGGAVGALLLFAGALVVLARPWPLEKLLRNLLNFLLCAYGGFLLMFAIGRLSGSHTDQNTTLRAIIAVLSFQGAALILVHFFLRHHHTNWTEGFGFKVNTRRALALGLGVGLVVLPTVLALQGLSILVIEKLTPLHPQEQEAVEILRATEDWSSRIILGIATVILAPIAEEVIFRGILYPTIKRAGYPLAALWGTSILFGLIHLNIATFVPLTFLAIVLVCLYEYTGNLLACITVHSFFNAANFVALYYQK